MQLASIPRIPLCHLPTPLERATRLEAALGPASPRIFLKRDDLTGLGFGGNKGRKLEYLAADALANGATVLITEGAAQSNHARITAAVAAKLGLKAVLVLDAGNGSDIGGNLLLDHWYGAETRIVPNPADRAAEMQRVADELTAAGETPVLIPTGGSTPLGALGYVSAMLELAGQLYAAGESPARLYVAAGSLGTLAGVVVGTAAVHGSWTVQGVSVSHSAASPVDQCHALGEAAAALIDLPLDLADDVVSVNPDFVGERYGVPTAAGIEAIHLLARTEAVLLDPVYTAKTFAAMLADIRAGMFTREQSIVFLHTGGTPALFAHGAALLASANMGTNTPSGS